MALAWLHYWAPDALIATYVDHDTVPLDVPDNWEFRLTPPAAGTPPPNPCGCLTRQGILGAAPVP